MTVTVNSFRTDFAEFSNTTDYPDPQVQFYLTMAGLLLNASRWQDMLDIATELFVAHNLSLEFMAKKEAANGNQPGAIKGALSAASVDKVSYSYDTSSILNVKDGHWNLTIYGVRYIRLVNMFGAGPIQVGVPSQCTPMGDAWNGPFGYWN